jgi:hypothetical protein
LPSSFFKSELFELFLAFVGFDEEGLFYLPCFVGCKDAGCKDEVFGVSSMIRGTLNG